MLYAASRGAQKMRRARARRRPLSEGDGRLIISADTGKRLFMQRPERARDEITLSEREAAARRVYSLREEMSWRVRRWLQRHVIAYMQERYEVLSMMSCCSDAALMPLSHSSSSFTPLPAVIATAGHLPSLFHRCSPRSVPLLPDYLPRCLSYVTPSPGSARGVGYCLPLIAATRAGPDGTSL